MCYIMAGGFIMWIAVTQTISVFKAAFG